jgi:hypothetical protein
LYIEDGNALVFDIQFAEPEAISAYGVDRDQVRIYLVETSSVLYCRPEQAGTELSTRRLHGLEPRHLQSSALTVPSNTILRVELPPQIEAGDEAAARKELNFGGEDEATDALVLGVGFSSFLSVPSQVLYDGLLAVQVVSHMPLNNVNFPRSSLNFMVFLNKIVSFNKSDPYDYIDADFSVTPPFNENFQWLGYGSMNFLDNLGMIGFLFLLVLLRQAVAPLFWWLQGFRCCACMRTKKRLLATSTTLCSNMWIRFFLMTYFEFVLACWTGLQLERFLP